MERPVPTDPISETAWLIDVSAADLLERMAADALQAEALVDSCLQRVAATHTRGPELRAVLAVDPSAAAQARALDAASRTGGPLHGLPVLLKDNIDSFGMATTAGSLALAEHRPRSDAFLVARLRESGAVVFGKANLSEWANFRSTQSSSGWSAVGGQTRNPLVLDRSPCGSSSGSAVAVAAGLVPLAVGTETDGSILCPASVNGIVGIKPTVGLVSRDGIVPLSHSQDTAGPMARTVADAARLLTVLAAADPGDPASAVRPADLDTDYLRGLDTATLVGKRVGVLGLGDAVDPRVTVLFEAAVAALEAEGAVAVPIDPLAAESASQADDQEWAVLVHEFGPDLAAYLEGVDGVEGLADLIAFNAAHAADELPWFGQEIFIEAEAIDRSDPSAYQAARAGSRETMAGFIDERLSTHVLDAIVVPTTGPAWPIDWVLGDRYTGGSSTFTAVSGYPAVTVPMGRVQGLPVGVSFMGTAYSEAVLVNLAHAYEQATGHRVAPGFLPTVGADPGVGGGD